MKLLRFALLLVIPAIAFSCKKDNGQPLGFRSSLALETQKWPDAVNHPDFTPVILRPGEQYIHTCIYRFGVTE